MVSTFRIACFLLLACFASRGALAADPAAELAAHLDRVAQEAARLEDQIAHPRGRPSAPARLEQLRREVELLQRATAALGESGAALEERRGALAARLRDGRERGFSAVDGSGSIAGVVTGPSLQQPLANVEVVAYRVDGGWSGNDFTDAGGFYQITGLGDGAYLVATAISSSGGPYLNETYDNVHCPNTGPCGAPDATPVTVADGGAVSGIHFRLEEGARLRGRVTDASGVPVAGAIVSTITSTGSQRQTVTDVVGRYNLGPLAPGSYRLKASSPTHIDELYPDVPCEDNCDHSGGTPITVGLGGQVTGLDFALRRHGALRGRVTDAVTAEPIVFASVRIENADASVSRNVSTGDDGTWESADLPAGTYFASAERLGYQAELFDEIPCPPNDCDLPKGDAIFLADQGTVSGIDFTLDLQGSIAGSIKAAATLAAVLADVRVYDAEGFFVGSGNSSFDGLFQVDRLDPGVYFVRTASFFSSEYRNELWQDLPCQPSCEVTAGEPVAVAAGATTGAIDFLLERLGRIEGHVLAAGGAPLAGVQITAYDPADLDQVASAETDAQGFYRLTRLPEGEYRLVARRQDYRGEIWDGIPCGRTCDPSLGADVAVGLGQTAGGVDFTLERLGFFSGIVTAEATGLPLAGIAVRILDSAGTLAASPTTGEDGRFSTGGLADGTYYALAIDLDFPRPDHFGEIYDGIDCGGVHCPEATTGTPIGVSLESSRADVDFTLRRSGRIAGTVIAAGTGLPPAAGGAVTIFTTAGEAFGVVNLGADGEFLVTGLATGSYYLMAASYDTALAREVWPSVVCPAEGNCSPLQGTAVAVTAGAESRADFSLDSLGRIRGRVIDAETGEPVGGGAVWLYRDGQLARSYLLGSDGRYDFTGLDPGSYRLRSAVNDEHIERVLGGGQCETGKCNTVPGTPIAAALNQITTAPDLALAFGPGIAGGVHLGGIAVANVGVDVFSLAGAYLGTAATGQSGRYRIAVPEGSYYVATDNGRGYVDEVHANVACPNGPAYLGLCDPQDGTPVAVDGASPATDGVDFDLASPVPGLFADGFESGGFGAWSQVLGGG